MIEYDPKGDVLFAATDVGVFDHKDGDASWYKISVGLPEVPVLDVKLSGDGKHAVSRRRSGAAVLQAATCRSTRPTAAARAARCRRRWR